MCIATIIVVVVCFMLKKEFSLPSHVAVARTLFNCCNTSRFVALKKFEGFDAAPSNTSELILGPIPTEYIVMPSFLRFLASFDISLTLPTLPVKN